MARVVRPPGPRAQIIGGSLFRFRQDPLSFLMECGRQYPDLCYFRAGHQHMYFLTAPELVREVLVTQSNAFIKSRILQRAKALLGNGLLTNEGASHLRQRRLVQPAFHRDRLVRYAGEMSQLAVRARERWTHGQMLDIDQEMMRLTLAIVGRTLFSADVEDAAPKVGDAVSALLSMMPILMLPGSQFFLYLPIPALRRVQAAAKTLDETIYQIIHARRRSGRDEGDLLSMMLLARDEGTGMTDQQVRDETLTLFIAGHETTATALTWTWYLLSQHPEAEARMHREVDEVLEGRTPTFDDVARLEYTGHVLAESMRLYPPAWAIGRMAAREVSIGGYMLPPGSIALASPLVMHRSASWWPEPDRFLPERWESGDPIRHKFAYFPFGGGPRLCIGERFAWMEGMLILATLARKWRFLRDDPKPVEMNAMLTLRPKGGIRMRVESR
jgi:cytochrome P450